MSGKFKCCTEAEESAYEALTREIGLNLMKNKNYRKKQAQIATSNGVQSENFSNYGLNAKPKDKEFISRPGGGGGNASNFTLNQRPIGNNGTNPKSKVKTEWVKRPESRMVLSSRLNANGTVQPIRKPKCSNGLPPKPTGNAASAAFGGKEVKPKNSNEKNLKPKENKSIQKLDASNGSFPKQKKNDTILGAIKTSSSVVSPRTIGTPQSMQKANCSNALRSKLKGNVESIQRPSGGNEVNLKSKGDSKSIQKPERCTQINPARKSGIESVPRPNNSNETNPKPIENKPIQSLESSNGSYPTLKNNDSILAAMKKPQNSIEVKNVIVKSIHATNSKCSNDLCTKPTGNDEPIQRPSSGYEVRPKPTTDFEVNSQINSKPLSSIEPTQGPDDNAGIDSKLKGNTLMIQLNGGFETLSKLTADSILGIIKRPESRAEDIARSNVDVESHQRITCNCSDGLRNPKKNLEPIEGIKCDNEVISKPKDSISIGKSNGNSELNSVPLAIAPFQGIYDSDQMKPNPKKINQIQGLDDNYRTKCIPLMNIGLNGENLNLKDTFETIGEVESNIPEIIAIPSPEEQQLDRKETKNKLEEIEPRRLVRHPLQHIWSLWYLENDYNTFKPWSDSLDEISYFNTIEDFWCLFSHIKRASEIKIGSDYSLFKKGIRPMWEDPANERGGRWVITLSKGSRRPDINTLWLHVMLSLIGEAFEHANDVCGAVLNNRPKCDRVSLWTSDAENKEAIKEIGTKLCQNLRLHPTELIFQAHKSCFANKLIPIPMYP